MKAPRWLAAFCFFLVCPTAPAAKGAECVGRLAEPSRWTIEGAKTFSAEEIRTALFDDFDVVAACDQGAPLDALTAVIEAKVTAGYQCAGFPDVKVTVVAAGNRLAASIDEGNRYRTGEVLVSGTQAIDGERIRHELTAGEPARNKRAVWGGEEHAPFNSEDKERVAAKVVELAGDQGFYHAVCNVVVKPDRQTRQGTLYIELIDEGPRTTLADVELTGNTLHSREKLLTYLDLQPQTPLTLELRQRIEKELLRSGRFLQARWELGEAAMRDLSWRPRLSLKEYELAPALDEPITREEAALLKLAEWVERFAESDEEVLVRFPGKSRIVFAPRHGFIVEAGAPPDKTPNESDGFSTAIVMAEERVGLYSATQRRKIGAAPPPGPIMGNAQITLVDGDLSGRGGLSAGAGLRTATSKALRRHVQMKLQLTAAAALSVVRTHKAKAHWEGDVVCLEWMDRQMRVNSLTGQLIEQVVHAATDDTEHGNSDDSGLHIKVARGQFESRLAKIEKISADWQNAADARRPLSCVAEFVCQELATFDAESKAGYAAVGKLMAGGLLQPFDELVVQLSPAKADAFKVPRRYFHFHFNSLSELFAQGPALARAGGMQLGNRLLPDAGWMQSVWRHAVFLMADGRTAASDALLCQAGDDAGPIWTLLSAEILHTAGLDQLAPISARRGLRRLSAAAFRDDCGDLLSGRRFASECLLQMAAAMRKLDTDDAKALADLLIRFDVLDAEQAAVFERCLAALHGDNQTTAAQAAGNALDAVWRGGLSDFVAQRLRSLASPLAPAIPAATYPATYGASDKLPGRPGYFSAPDIVPPSVTPPDSEKSIKQEVRELKWLAMAFNERLEKLERRLEHEGDDSTADSAEPVEIPAAPPANSQSAVPALDGYCPVTLVEKRIWQRGNTEFTAVHRGMVYRFINQAAQKTFLDNLERYTPALDGNDPVLAVDEGTTVAGRREHGAFYHGRVFLFSSEKTLEAFETSPDRYLDSAPPTAEAAMPLPKVISQHR